MGQDRVHPDRDDGFRTSFGAVFRDRCHMSGRLPAISRRVRFGVPRPHGVHSGDFRGGLRRQLAARDEDPSITSR